MYKNAILAIGILLVTIFATTNNANAESIVAKQNLYEFEASYNYFHFDYKETLPLPLKSTEKENLVGIHLVYTYKNPTAYNDYRIEKPSIYRIMIDYADGDTFYDGSTQDGVPLTGTTHNLFFNGEFTIGFPLHHTSRITAYLGIGYRNWMRGDIGGPGSYSEEYSWSYMPLGFKTDFIKSKKFTASLDISAHLMFNGKIKVYFSEFDPTYNDGEAKIGNKCGWKIEAPAQYRFANHLSFVFTPWYEYSAIGRGDYFTLTDGVDTFYAVEPASQTHQHGVNIGFKAHF